MVETAVLFQTFARPDYARKVFDAIKVCKPKKFYFYSNKAREERPDELRRNEEIRNWAKEVDWDCELHTWFRDEYVDVYTSLKGAVDWVCENENSWIVLEEDIVPSLAFFSFCDQLINYYRNDKRVWYISGDNFFNLNPSGYDYIFTHYHWMYGWATWRDRWLSVDWDNLRINEMISQGVYNHFYKTKNQAKERIRMLLRWRSFIERTKCWDYYFGIVCDQNNAVGIRPKQHLITNIGMEGEHHKKAIRHFVNAECSYLNSEYLIENKPPFVFADYDFDYQELCKERKFIPLWKRIAYPFLNFYRDRFIYKCTGK